MLSEADPIVVGVGRTCTVCKRPDAEHLDQLILSGMPLEEIARRSSLSASSLRRHRDAHLGPKLLLSLQAAGLDQERLVQIIIGLSGRMLVLAEKAEALDDLALVRSLVIDARETLVTAARIAGYLQPSPISVDVRQQSLALLTDVTTSELRAIIARAASENSALPAAEDAPE